VKLVDKESLLREKEAKKRAEAEKAAEKERRKAQQAVALIQLEAQRKVKPSELFLPETDKYSRFDEKVCNCIVTGQLEAAVHIEHLSQVYGISQAQIRPGMLLLYLCA
jgi:cysteinyl-tRNA synthetase